LIVHAEIKSETDGIFKLKTEGQIDGKTAVSGIMMVERFNLADRNRAAPETDAHMIHEFRQNYERLLDPFRKQESLVKS
jgi:hypothetical protein